ncbi:MAG: biotin/lipoyl-containing protein [Thermoanaerobaculia bacterium]
MKLIARHDDEAIPVEIQRHGTGYRILLRDEWITAELVVANRFVRMLRLEDGRQFLLVHHQERGRHEISVGDRTVHLEVVDPLTMRRKGSTAADAGAGTVRALMPGRVVKVLVAEGDDVSKGDPLMVLEAMKMENQIAAPRDGKVGALHVVEGQTVEGGAELITIES